MIKSYNFHFKFYFHHFVLRDEMNEIRSRLHMFKRIFKSKIIWIKFPIFSSPKILACFYFFFPFLFWPTNILSPIFLSPIILSVIFFCYPLSSSTQVHIRPTDLIFFGHLRPPDDSHRLGPPCHCSLCRLPPAPWSRLASSPSENGRTSSPPLPCFHLP
jgi:hypothetical protein